MEQWRGKEQLGMTDNIRWGILGTGIMARLFASELAFLPDAELVAVGSRAAATADDFANEFDVPHRHASYDGLVGDPDVDVVFIATPHPLHKEHSILALSCGKAVLCEKPFAINASEAEAMIRFAREQKLFLMEAMYTRFVPAVGQVRQWLAEGVIGEARALIAEYGIQADFDPQHRWFAPELGGGALLDLGIYPVSLASMVFGPPARITSMCHLGETGVDEQAAIILGYDEGQLASLFTALRSETPWEAVIQGTKGRIKLHRPLYSPAELTLTLTGQEDQVVEMPFPGEGYTFEAVEVMRCLRAGELESDVMPLDETLAIMKTMDQIRAQWGLKYPTE
jgi:predicted dehydrogenase